MSDHHQRPVLVTGGTGSLAGHCLLQLLAAGRPVRATVRTASRGAALRTALAGAGASTEQLRRLRVVTADLTDDAGWAEAVAGADAVLHVASPVRPGHVEDEDELVVPARGGTLRVLRAARDAGVRRVVVTSAFHAVGFGHGRLDRELTEDDWSPLHGPGTDAYGRSKVLAERAAWEFTRAEPGAPELVTLLPVAVVGPLLGDAVSGANHLLQRMLSGALPALPDLAVPFVDVRDVAAAHVAALDAPGAAGQRVILAAQERATPLREVAALLRAELGERAAAVPTRQVPSVALRLAARFRPGLRGTVADLGHVKQLSTRRQRDLLGLEPRPWQEAVAAGARSLLDRGLVVPPARRSHRPHRTGPHPVG
ncbi:NAD-dependent epimerase/dehydratase family protein [Kineococcus terrestris]|uniref:NAD-dependent epimerase/dehydratase family protein n=1 Tax=Kineococcus terrestris TaxID=2044856 RepID=UPI0034DB482D